MAELIRLVIVDDHPVVAGGLAAILRATPGLEVVGLANDIAAARVLIAREEPDVVLCDVMFGPRAAGFDLVTALAGRVPIILFSSFDMPAYFQAALERGAAGYVLKHQPVEAVVSAIRTVAAGGTAFSRQALALARGAVRPPSPREREVIALVAAGRSNGEVASALGIEENTVETHLRRMYTRYGILSRTELAMRSIREGWIEPHG